MLLLSLHCETNGDMMAGVSRLLGNSTKSVLPTHKLGIFRTILILREINLVNAKCQKVPDEINQNRSLDFTVLGRLICNFHFVTLRFYVKSNLRILGGQDLQIRSFKRL